MSESKEIFNKIIYFDEDSATDLVYMCNQGEIEQEILKGYKTNIDDKANIKAEIGVKGIIKSIFGVGGEASIGASFGSSREDLLNRVIKNTVLTDYLQLDFEDNNIIIFDDSKVYPYENSLSYIKLITPYLIMTEGKLDAGDFKINVQLMDKALNQSKGYYEMILESQGCKNILRFNLASFRNSYLLPDLVKMNLTFHCIKVGCTNLSKLDIENEFGIMNDSKDLDGFEEANKQLGKTLKNNDEKIVDVYDVILAGVKI